MKMIIGIMIVIMSTFTQNKIINQEKTIGYFIRNLNFSPIFNTQSEHELLNKPIFHIDSIDAFKGINEEEVYLFSEEVKGGFNAIVENRISFPPELIYKLEDALYNSCNYSPQKLITENTFDNKYFNTIESLGSNEYKLSLNDLYRNFPQLLKNAPKFENEYVAFKYITGSDNCSNMFSIKESDGTIYYLLVFDFGNSDGHVQVRFTQFINNQFVTIHEIRNQNNGFGNVIRYNDIFYYVYLHYNYNLKNYDSIMLYKIDKNFGYKENALIQYLPEEYIWKNVFSFNDVNSNELSSYIDNLKKILVSNQYLENGFSNDIEVLNGDEESDYNFFFANQDKYYYVSDFVNLGLPIFITKSNNIPSDYRSTWNLNINFYTLNTKTNTLLELTDMSLGDSNLYGNELVQMWFKKIGDKIYTFRIYHISDYNYILNTSLVTGDKVQQIRNDIFSPKRKFTVREDISEEVF